MAVCGQTEKIWQIILIVSDLRIKELPSVTVENITIELQLGEGEKDIRAILL